jgi:hypothetical protein
MSIRHRIVMGFLKCFLAFWTSPTTGVPSTPPRICPYGCALVQNAYLASNGVASAVKRAVGYSDACAETVNLCFD